MSNTDETSKIIKGFKYGCVDYITKPINIEEAFARIKTHLIMRNQQIQLNEISLKKDRFFSIISHDLRSPFMALIGLSDLLNHSIPELTQKEI